MIHFIVHGKKDTVGVAVQDLKSGQEITGWNMETDDSLQETATQNILLGHKVALKDMRVGEEIIKYNVVIGVVTKPVSRGDHIHVHNLKSARWSFQD